ncbi:MAG: enoyl-CoA hydratase/isomerase family protein [Halioglobus sp.]|nr:enoyl-CoA hydratase/isomerase family protein [Halioglobus sp.]
MTITAVIVTRPTPHVAQVAINRPEAKNAIDEATRLALIDTIEATLADDTVRALLLCGTNGVFCAGGDLASMRGMSEEQARARMQSGHKLVQLLWNADIPVVVAMEKFAIGAGAGLALVSDYIVAGETARMNFPFLNLGLVPDWGSAQSLVRKAGWGTARRLVLDRVSLKGEQLLELKLVEQIVEDDKVMAFAADKAREFSLLPRLALRQFKETMRQSPLAMKSALQAEESHQTHCFLSDEFEEGLTALQEKRPPDFLKG